MVFDVKPIAHLHAVAIHRQWLARQGIDNHERDELFGEMQGAVVVAAIGGEHRQAVGVMPRTNQVIAGRLAGTVGAVGLVRMLLGKGWILGRQTAIHLIGRDMQEPELALGIGLQTLPVAAHRLQQTEGAHNVGFNEFAGSVNGAINVALGCKIQNCSGLVLGQKLGQQSRIANVTLHKHVLRLVFQGCQ